MANRASLATLFLHGLLYDKPASLTSKTHRRAHRLAQASLLVGVVVFGMAWFAAKRDYWGSGVAIGGVHVNLAVGKLIVFTGEGPFMNGITSLTTEVLRDVNIQVFIFRFRMIGHAGQDATWTLELPLVLYGFVLISTFLIWGVILVNRWRLVIVGADDMPCPACGYDLRATPTRCPECGMKIEPTATRTTSPEA